MSFKGMVLNDGEPEAPELTITEKRRKCIGVCTSVQVIVTFNNER